MKRRTKIIAGVVAVLVAVLITAGFVSRRGEDVTAVTMFKGPEDGSHQQGHRERAYRHKRKVDLSANVMGKIVNVAVREGDVVSLHVS